MCQNLTIATLGGGNHPNVPPPPTDWDLCQTINGKQAERFPGPPPQPLPGAQGGRVHPPAPALLGRPTLPPTSRELRVWWGGERSLGGGGWVYAPRQNARTSGLDRSVLPPRGLQECPPPRRSTDRPIDPKAASCKRKKGIPRGARSPRGCPHGATPRSLAVRMRSISRPGRAPQMPFAPRRRRRGLRSHRDRGLPYGRRRP